MFTERKIAFCEGFGIVEWCSFPGKARARRSKKYIYISHTTLIPKNIFVCISNLGSVSILFLLYMLRTIDGDVNLFAVPLLCARPSGVFG